LVRKKSNRGSVEKVNNLAHAYFRAKSYVIKAGFLGEIEWQESQLTRRISQREFLKEAAWVILSSGLSEKCVKVVFPKLTKCFFNWNSKQIVQERHRCRRNALYHFGNRGKIEAILSMAVFLHQNGLRKIISSVNQDGIEYLNRFPFFGPATSYHLAKNVGFDVSKPDRHLVRIAGAAGFKCSFDMCKNLGSRINESVAVIDLVLWRYATLNATYLKTFSA